MKATTLLHDLGQSIWLDNITRDLTARLQDEGAKSFATSWHGLMDVIGSKSAALA